LSNEVIDIVTNGVGAANAVSMPTPAGTDTGISNAKDLLLANRDFLVAETFAWINYQASQGISPFDKSINYDETKCQRDTGLILDAVGYDLALGTNYNAVTTGLAYQRYSYTRLPAEKTVTLSAIQYVKSNVLALIEDSTATTRASAAFDEIVDIITNGIVSTSTSADELVFPTPVGASVGKVNAKDQLLANKDFLKETQKHIKACPSLEIDNSILEKYRLFKSETSFIEKYQYIGFKMFKKFNYSSVFLHGLGLYNLASPLISLFTPLLVLIVPFIILKMKGMPITIAGYVEFLKIMIINILRVPFITKREPYQFG
jgi:hypothetical protein